MDSACSESTTLIEVL